jgi:hypothetical protein
LANIRISGKEVAVDYCKALSWDPHGGTKTTVSLSKDTFSVKIELHTFRIEGRYT